MSCVAITKLGKGCSRKATGNTSYCAQHLKLNQPTESKENLIPDLCGIVNSYIPLNEYYLKIGKDKNFTILEYNNLQNKLELQYITQIEQELKDAKINLKTEINDMLTEKKDEIEVLKKLPNAEPSTSTTRALFKANIISIISNFINLEIYKLISALEDTNIFKYNGDYGDSKTNTYYNIRSLYGYQIKKFFDISVSYKLGIRVGEYPKFGINSGEKGSLVITKFNKKSSHILSELPVKDLQKSLYKTFVDIIYTEMELLKYFYEKTSDLIVYDFNPY